MKTLKRNVAIAKVRLQHNGFQQQSGLYIQDYSVYEYVCVSVQACVCFLAGMCVCVCMHVCVCMRLCVGEI